MNDTNTENNQFKMPLDETIEESPLLGAVDELRLEKINTRVTIISVIIPVLIVVVLVIAYMDIKKRVVQTEDTGVMGVQKLSTDLESRFSSLSIRQARLEDETIRMGQNVEKSLARVEVKLKKLTDAVEDLKKLSASKSELRGKVATFDNKVDNLAGSIEEIDLQLAALGQGLKTEMANLVEGINTNRVQLEDVDAKITAMDRLKIEKPALELALRLEALKIEQSLKARLDSVQSELQNLDRKVRKLTKQTTDPAQTPARPATPSPPPTGPASGRIQEQPIPQ